MAGAVVSTVSNILKYRYLGPLQTQVNNEVLVTQILKLDTKRIDLDGLQAVVPLHYGRNGSGVGARRENENLPSAGAQAYQKALFDLKYMYGSAQFTGQAIQKTKTDAGAFVRVITDELDRLRDDLTLDMARQVYGDGTGAIATVSVGVTAGTTITLSSAEAIDKGFLYINMPVDIGSVGSPTAKATAAVISDVDPVAATVTFSANVTCAANDLLFRASNVDATGAKEIDAGLQALIPTAANTIGGINASAAGSKWWDNRRDTSGGTVALSNLMQMSNKLSANGAKLPNLVALTTPGLARRLFETSDFKAQVRFTDSGMLDGGFEKITFATGAGRMTLVTDRHAPYGKVHFVDTNAIKVYSTGDWEYLSRDGLTIRWVSGVDAFQAILFRYMNLGTNRRNTSGVYSGLTDNGF